MSMNEMRDASTMKLAYSMSEDKTAEHSSLFLMTDVAAIEEMTSTLREFRTYCKRKEYKFLAHLIEMAVMGAMELQTPPQTSKRK